MNTFIKTTLAVTLAIFSSTAAMGQSESANAEGIGINITKNGRIEFKELTENKWFQDLSSRIKLHGYAQAGYTYSRHDGTNVNTFDVKRILFWVDAKITDRWSFLFMHDFSSVVQEFYTDFRITKNKALTFLTGCGSDPLLGTQYGRDLGLSLFGETNNGKFRYELDVMNGQGINKKDGNNFKDIITRFEYRPVTGLNIVATGQIGRGHSVMKDGNVSVYNPTIANGQDYKRHRCTIGADYKSKAFNVHGEYLNGWDGDAHSWGAYVTGAVPLARFGSPELGKRLELVASYDFFNFNTDLGMDQHKAIGGLQYWFYKKCRLQVQYVYKSAYSTPTVFAPGAHHAIMCQMQVRFN